MKSKSARWFAVLAIVIALIAIQGTALSAQEESAGANYVSPHLWTVDVGKTLDQGITLWTAAISICALLGVGGYIGLRLWFPNLRNKAAISFGVGIAICGIWIGSAALRAGKVEIAGGHVGVIYQQGRDVAQIGPGLHFIIPWRQRVRVFYARDFTFATISDPHNG